MKASATRILHPCTRSVFAGSVIETADTDPYTRAVANDQQDVATVGEAVALYPAQPDATVREVAAAGSIATTDQRVQPTASGARWWAARQRAGGRRCPAHAYQRVRVPRIHVAAPSLRRHRQIRREIAQLDQPRDPRSRHVGRHAEDGSAGRLHHWRACPLPIRIAGEDALLLPRRPLAPSARGGYGIASSATPCRSRPE